ncbi:hypothetical protein [Metabacillus arenae]|uniref:Uncharacterized protein n=1 Tax=Metabacillus arenae TaxID=2771434 RepID=A0A926S0T1_9BACI|nr:hypothetical protein [Metabacillus arenae]MBD1380329.1 hypothetical protein [Metabacillus arenae]
MKKEEAVDLAMKIIALDLKRDEMLEDLLVLVGRDAHAFLRQVQNGAYKTKNI